MMGLTFLAAATATATVMAPIGAAQPLSSGGRMAGPAVVVLWASWCASCRAEMQRLPALARAAAPLPILTLAVDPPDRARQLMRARGMPVERGFADPRDPRVVLDAWGGTGSAMPIAVAIDRTGHVCGRKLGLLGTDQLKAWATSCAK